MFTLYFPCVLCIFFIYSLFLLDSMDWCQWLSVYYHYKFAKNEMKYTHRTRTTHTYTFDTRTLRRQCHWNTLNSFRLIRIVFAFFWVAGRFKGIVFAVGADFVVTFVCFFLEFFCYNVSLTSSSPSSSLLLLFVVGGLRIWIVFNQTNNTSNQM